ncbi:hypothetical protein KDV89_12710 [Providencia stuartii]
MYMRHLLKIAVLLTTTLHSISVSANEYAQDDESYLQFLNEDVSYYCYSELENLILSSNYPPAVKYKKSSDRVSMDASYQDENILEIGIIDSCSDYLPGEQLQRPIGTLSYLLRSNTLWMTDSDGRKLKQLAFDKKLGEQYQNCIKREQFCSQRREQIGSEFFSPKSDTWVVVGEKKAYFHSAPTPECKSNINFVIPNDKVKVFNQLANSMIDDEENEYVFVSYGRARGWLNVESVSKPEDIYYKLEEPSKGNYRVKEKRLYFYEDPALACEKPGQPYVIEGDSVWLFSAQEFPGFAYASYTNPNTGTFTTGWLRINGLEKE